MSPLLEGASEDAVGPDQLQYEPWLFQTMLDELSVSELGIGFIYSVLDVLVKRYALNDAVVILSHESFGAQMFRAGGQAISVDLASRLIRCASISGSRWAAWPICGSDPALKICP